MRGTVPMVIYPFIQRRITPAHAGNSIGADVTDHGIGDHPRSCGEQMSQSH